jgi:hypothetical protein
MERSSHLSCFGHAHAAPWEPTFFPELQGHIRAPTILFQQGAYVLPIFHTGGSLDGWGGAGYDGCDQLTGLEFVNVCPLFI